MEKEFCLVENLGLKFGDNSEEKVRISRSSSFDNIAPTDSKRTSKKKTKKKKSKTRRPHDRYESLSSFTTVSSTNSNPKKKGKKSSKKSPSSSKPKKSSSKSKSSRRRISSDFDESESSSNGDGDDNRVQFFTFNIAKKSKPRKSLKPPTKAPKVKLSVAITLLSRQTIQALKRFCVNNALHQSNFFFWLTVEQFRRVDESAVNHLALRIWQMYLEHRPSDTLPRASISEPSYQEIKDRIMTGDIDRFIFNHAQTGLLSTFIMSTIIPSFFQSDEYRACIKESWKDLYKIYLYVEKKLSAGSSLTSHRLFEKLMRNPLAIHMFRKFLADQKPSRSCLLDFLLSVVSFKTRGLTIEERRSDADYLNRRFLEPGAKRCVTASASVKKQKEIFLAVTEQLHDNNLSARAARDIFRESLKLVWWRLETQEVPRYLTSPAFGSLFVKPSIADVHHMSNRSLGSTVDMIRAAGHNDVPAGVEHVSVDHPIAAKMKKAKKARARSARRHATLPKSTSIPGSMTARAIKRKPSIAQSLSVKPARAPPTHRTALRKSAAEEKNASSKRAALTKRKTQGGKGAAKPKSILKKKRRVSIDRSSSLDEASSSDLMDEEGLVITMDLLPAIKEMLDENEDELVDFLSLFNDAGTGDLAQSFSSGGIQSPMNATMVQKRPKNPASKVAKAKTKPSAPTRPPPKPPAPKPPVHASPPQMLSTSVRSLTKPKNKLLGTYPADPTTAWRELRELGVHTPLSDLVDSFDISDVDVDSDSN